MLTGTDSNGLISRMSYDDASRMLQSTLPQPLLLTQPRTYIDYAYDDTAMTTTQSEWTISDPLCVQPHCNPVLQAQTVTQLNGPWPRRKSSEQCCGRVGRGYAANMMPWAACGRFRNPTRCLS